MGVRRNPAGGAQALGAQDATFFSPSQLGINAATANGAGTTVDSEGFNGAMIVDVWNTGSGTATFSVEGTDDGGTTWWGIGVDVMASGTGIGSTVAAAAGTLTRAANAPLAASGSSGAAQRLALLDPAIQIRCRLTSVSGSVAVTAQLIAIGA